VPDTISGRITDSGDSGIDPNSVMFEVVDEFGAVQPSGRIVLKAPGRYSFTLMLEASRLGEDLDGR
jgi:hypothetical protein